MALTKNCTKFLFYAKTLGASFDKTIMLGRLSLDTTREEIQSNIDKFRNNVRKIEEVAFKDGYSEPLFEILGASTIDSIDVSAYENATIIHDMNQPIKGEMKGKYTAVVDAGTIEHVFNFPVAIKNCMEMLQVGGNYIGITPANNLLGHGLYQFSPELFYSIFREENGFVVKKMIIYTQDAVGQFSDWYEVKDPRKAKSRVMLINSNETFLLVLAEKIAERSIFQKPPQQSDYEMAWDIKESLQNKSVPKNEGRLKYVYRKYTPRPVKILAHNIYNLFTRQEIVHEDLGRINADHFKKMDI